MGAAESTAEKVSQKEKECTRSDNNDTCQQQQLEEEEEEEQEGTAWPYHDKPIGVAVIGLGQMG